MCHPRNGSRNTEAAVPRSQKFVVQITVNSLLRERSSRLAFRKHRLREDIEMESPKDVALAVAAIGRIEAVPTLLRVLCDITGMES